MGAKIWQLLVTIFIKIWFTTAQTLDIDYASLHAIKASWQNTPPSWDDSSDPCGVWEGIKCTNSRVTNIVLTNLQLNGGFPEDIGNFTELQRLDLSYNTKLTGSLPAQAIDKLRKLRRLALVGCRFNGEIPDTIGNLDSLTYLALNSNRFTGSIPASIGNLKSLDWLDLSGNRLSNNLPVSSGTMPGLDMLTSTKHFHLGGNQLSGDIPPSLFNSNMTLKHLLLENNNLTGNIPLTLGLVQSLKVVRLDRNSLSGNVPSNINNLTSVNEMFLSKNRLTGPIPDLTAMNALKYLDLSNNTFDESEVPSWFSTLQSLTTLNMHATNIGGELPAALFSIPDLQNVDLSNNRLSGTLSIGSTPSNQLQLVDLRTNQIGDFTQRGQDEVNITLVDNPICMGVGHTEKFCTAPQNTISSNSITPNNCPLPPSCDSGQVSSPNCQCAYPFTGYFTFKAPSFSDLGNLTRYDSLRKLLMTYFKDYRYPIDSVSLKNATKSWEDYLRIKLEAFPSGNQTFNRTTINGLSSLFSNQEFKPGDEFNIYEFLADDYFSGSSRDKSSNTGLIIGSAVGGCVLLVLLVLAGMYAFRQKVLAERAAQQSHPFALWDPTSGSGGVPQLKGARSFSFEELKKYTSNFTEINNIGSGGYGMVYRGCLPNGQLIAIKRARKGSTQGGVEFKTEIELLSRVHHKNVVGLVGFCFDQGEQMLVYEYIANGTLKDSLSGRSGIRLDWMRRLRIALGAARGLQYLHDLADPPIIHRDIKTNNILLDERLVAKVADFGLSKPLSDSDKTHITTQAKGTLGYMDPEYYMTQQLTEKSDIYSFGVVMLELITARRPIEKGKYIVREVKQAMNNSKELYNLQDLVDPTMGLSNQLKGLERFVDLSLRCVEEMGSQRPTMSEVVKEIESIIQVAGFNPYAESSTSTSKSYEGASKDYDYLYSNDSLFSYSGGFMPPKL